LSLPLGFFETIAQSVEIIIM